MDKITIKSLTQIINVSDSTISRLKGTKNLPHDYKDSVHIKDNKLVDPLLSRERGILTLEDLKKFIIYSLIQNRKNTILKNVQATKNLLLNKPLDAVVQIVVSNNKYIRIEKEELYKDLSIEVCLKILKQIYIKEIKLEEEYKTEEILNVEIQEEEQEESDVLQDKEIEKYNYTNILDYIYYKYSQYKNGYFPLQHPTGNGKTYFLEKFLIKNILEDFKNLKQERIIVITNSKVNINEIYRNISEKLKDQGEEEKVNSIFLMKSVDDIFYNIEFLKEIIEELQQTSAFYKEFPRNFIYNFRQKLEELIKFVDKKIKINMLEQLKEYIPLLKKEMFRYFKRNNDLSGLPKFLLKLYPMIIEENNYKKIYLMTTDKFLYGYVGREETKYFYENEKSLIFIDEIDSAKQNFFKFIKNQRTLYIENIIDVFNERYNSFSKRENNQLFNLLRRLNKIEEKLFNNWRTENIDISDKKIEKIKLKKKDLINKISIFEKEGKKLRKKYFTTKRYYELEEAKRIDLFEEEQNYFQANGKKYYLNINNENCQITTNKTKLELSKMIKELFNYCYGHFYYLLTNIYNYHRLLIEENEIEKEIISHLFYNMEIQNEILNEYKNFFIKRLRKKKKKTTSEIYDIDDRDKEVELKNCCFQIYENNPDYTLNRKVSIGSQYMYITPELLLLNMCEKNFIFGISATANMETCMGNFDIKWLRSKLKNNYFSLTTLEKEKLKEALLKINSFEKGIERKINIYCGKTEMSKGFENIKKLITKKSFMFNKMLNILDSLFPVEDEDQDKKIKREYFEYAYMVFLNFILEKNTRSLLFMSNRLTQTEILEKAVLKIGEVLNKQVFFKALSSKELDENLENKNIESNILLKNLRDNNIKTIIFTTYQSAGTGVNIKHEYGNSLKNKLVKIDKEIEKENNFRLKYKDIDEIALENKTHLINFDENNMRIEMLYYCNLLIDNNVIDKKERSILLNRCSNMIFTARYKTKYDYIENSMGKIIQAIGRCNRTKVRNKTRNIYLDEAGFNIISKFKSRNRLFIEDINYLLEKAQEINLEKRNLNSLQKEIILQNKKVERYFEESYLNNISEYNAIMSYSKDEKLKKETFIKFEDLYKKYDNFRRYILKYPTRSEESKKNYSYFSIGEKLDGYKVVGDSFQNIESILFDTTEKNISIDECRLKEIVEIPLLKEFCSNNIGMFEKNEEIILPYIYQAIFKGMLGEVIIKEIFRMYNINLKNINEMIDMGIVERFDDISENGMYIDYKNYNLDKMNRNIFTEGIRKKIIIKKSLINNQNKLFIINLISNKIKGKNKDIAFYKKTNIIEEIDEVCSYEESEVVIIAGVLRYKEDGETLEINENLMRVLKNMLRRK